MLGHGKFRVMVGDRVSLGLGVRIIVRVRISVMVMVSTTQHFNNYGSCSRSCSPK